MLDVDEGVQISYSDLIKEAYIDPIRTVVVIDDEFPSLDGLIAKELGDEGSWNGERDNALKVKEILEFCRTREKPWLVDVHDGKKIEVTKDAIVAPYLHHSDLVILDYHLNGDAGNGDKAINILRKLAENDHFNMVVVYTKGYPGKGSDIERVVREIALGLTAADTSLDLSPENTAAVLAAIAEWEIEDDAILEKLQTEVTSETYLAVRSLKHCNIAAALGMPECRNILNLYKHKPKDVKIKPKDLLQWLLIQKEKELETLLSRNCLGQVTVSDPRESVNWIRTDRLFVSVVSKTYQPQEIPDELLKALNVWCPRPHRLLMAKIRSLIDQRGAVAEAEALSNDFIQTGWLLDLLEAHEKDRIGAISKTINRHWEALGGAITTDIKCFGEHLIQHIVDQGREEILTAHSPLNITSEAKNISKHLNCYVSTKPIEGFHLSTGHVLEFATDDAQKEYGICLSPACDMVPGQKTSGWFGRLGNFAPFIMVSLSEITPSKALEKVDQNIFLFLKIDDDIRTFTFNPNGELKSNPSWEQMFASDNGLISNGNNELTVGRLTSNATNLITEPVQTKIVAQLRYEYAINLLQRLGVSMSRVGLDYKNFS